MKLTKRTNSFRADFVAAATRGDISTVERLVKAADPKERFASIRPPIAPSGSGLGFAHKSAKGGRRE